MKRKLLTAILILALPALALCPAPFSHLSAAGRDRAGPEQFDELDPEELQGRRYYYMVDEDERILLVTGHRLGTGDRYLTAGNDLYEVESMEGYLARARLVEKVDLIVPPDFSAGSPPFLPVQGRGAPAYRIAIYHTHNAECYVPSDDTDSIYGTGGIHDVGLAFKEALEKKGIDVLYSDQLHLPHDRGAYRRSRVTALRLLRQHPDAIFDVHRDAAPWETYALELDGEAVTQVQIVVGLSNPGTATNQQFAYDLKGYADRLYPDLIHGVLTIWGSYNQDLSPLALLLEVGAHTNTKESAMRGIARFADVVSYYFYGPAFIKGGKMIPKAGELPPGSAAGTRENYGIMHAVSGTVLSFLLASLGAALGFYFLNNPGLPGRLLHFWRVLPGRLRALAGQGRGYLRRLPDVLKAIRKEAPSNLRRAWLVLGLERRIVPGLLRALASALLLFARKLGGAAIALWKEAPLNLKRGWQLLRREKRLLPRLLRDTVGSLRNGGQALFRRAASEVRSSREKLGRALEEAGAEGAALAELLRRSYLLLRNRLRP